MNVKRFEGGRRARAQKSSDHKSTHFQEITNFERTSSLAVATHQSVSQSVSQ